MSLAELEKKIADLKEVSPDDRIDIMTEIEGFEDRVFAARDALAAIPDTEPPEGVQNPRAAFVDGLIAEAGGEARAVDVN